MRFTLVGGPPGARCEGQYVLTPIRDGTATRVEATLMSRVVGPLSLLVSKKELRVRREAKLRADLTDMARQFAQ